MSDPGLIERYGWRLGFPDTSSAVGLGEGRAPLVSAEALLEPYGYRGELYVHFEAAAPHGSYRDRGAAVAASAARRDGYSALELRFADTRSRVVTEAYARRGGLAVGTGEGGTTEAELHRLALDESSTAWRAGLATSAWDVFDQLEGRAPEHHLCPADELARALLDGYEVLRREGTAIWIPQVEQRSAVPSERAIEGLRRLGIEPSPERAAAVEAVLELLDEGRFRAPAAIVLTLPW